MKQSERIDELEFGLDVIEKRIAKLENQVGFLVNAAQSNSMLAIWEAFKQLRTDMDMLTVEMHHEKLAPAAADGRDRQDPAGADDRAPDP